VGNTKLWNNKPLIGYCTNCDHIVVYSKQWSYSVTYNPEIPDLVTRNSWRHQAENHGAEAKTLANETGFPLETVRRVLAYEAPYEDGVTPYPDEVEGASLFSPGGTFRDLRLPRKEGN